MIPENVLDKIIVWILAKSALTVNNNIYIAEVKISGMNGFETDNWTGWEHTIMNTWIAWIVNT